MTLKDFIRKAIETDDERLANICADYMRFGFGMTWQESLLCVRESVNESVVLPVGVTVEEAWYDLMDRAESLPQ